MLGFLAVAALAAQVETAAAAADDTYVQTTDGAWIALHRYANPGGPPVVLCHGISSNARFWDLEPDRSLARTLWAAGYDVWNLDLRGHGAAEDDPEGHHQRGDWSIDDYGTRDLPAAFAHVLAETGQEQLGYVGHSMGGMVLAVYLATHAETPLNAAVVVGSPLDFRDPDALFGTVMATGGLFTPVPWLPTPLGARLFGRMGKAAPLHSEDLLANPENIERKAAIRMMDTVVSPLYRGEVKQFRASPDGEFRSADGSVNYRLALGDVTVPMRFLAGRDDHVVSPDRVWSYYEAVPRAARDFVVLSTANGFHGDYGHLDLGLGDHAAEDVFPLIQGWLDAHR